MTRKELKEKLEPWRVSTLPLVYKIDKTTLDLIERTISDESRKSRIWYMHRMAERGVVNFKNLTPREQKILTNRFIEGNDLETVGQMYGVTRERIRQIEEKALTKLDEQTLPI